MRSILRAEIGLHYFSDYLVYSQRTEQKKFGNCRREIMKAVIQERGFFTWKHCDPQPLIRLRN